MDKANIGCLQPSELYSDDDFYSSSHSTQTSPAARQHSIQTGSMRHSRPRPPPTPNTGIPPSIPQNIPNPLLPSAPASPPTPAPSPTPLSRSSVWKRASVEVEEDIVLKEFRLAFSRLDVDVKKIWLESIVESCDNHLLSHLHHLVGPKLKKDPFQTLPNELCFEVC